MLISVAWPVKRGRVQFVVEGGTLVHHDQAVHDNGANLTSHQGDPLLTGCWAAG